MPYLINPGLRVAIAVTALTACAQRADDRSLLITDSAGITIVTQALPGDSVPIWSVDASAPVFTVGGPADSTGSIGTVVSAVALANGVVVVSSIADPRLRAFDRSGREIAQAGRSGMGPGEFRMPPILRLYHDSVVAFEMIRDRAVVTMFDRRLIAVRSSAKTFTQVRQSGPSPLGIVPDGTILFSTEDIPQSASGRHRAKLTLFAVTPNGDSGSVVLRAEGDEREVQPGHVNWQLVFGKRTVTAVTGGLVYVGTNDGFSIGAYDPTGRLHRIVRLRSTPTAVTERMRTRYAAESSVNLDPEVRRILEGDGSSAPFAKTLRYYDALRPTREGGLWIELARISEDDVRRYYVLDERGVLIARATVPANLVPISIWGDTVLVRGSSDDGFPYVAIVAIRR